MKFGDNQSLTFRFIFDKSIFTEIRKNTLKIIEKALFFMRNSFFCQQFFLVEGLQSIKTSCQFSFSVVPDRANTESVILLTTEIW